MGVGVFPEIVVNRGPISAGLLRELLPLNLVSHPSCLPLAQEGKKKQSNGEKKKILKSILDYTGGGPKSNDKHPYKMKRGCRYKDDGGRD